MTTKELYHGAHTKYVLHKDQCYTDDYEEAEYFADGSGEIGEINIDMSKYNVYEDVTYDHDTDWHPSDDADYCREMEAKGYDILMYEDEDVRGYTLTCYRLISDRIINDLKEE